MTKQNDASPVRMPVRLRTFRHIFSLAPRNVTRTPNWQYPGIWKQNTTNKGKVGASSDFFRHDRTALASFDVIHVLYESPLSLGSTSAVSQSAFSADVSSSSEFDSVSASSSRAC